MEYGLLIILMYGAIHAFGPDHLSAIAITSVGKTKKEIFIISSLFALTHGIVLFLLAKVLYLVAGSFIIQYADVISWSILFLLGVNLIYIGMQDNLEFFIYKNKYNHKPERFTIISLGLLMGLGGLRGMLLTMGAISTTALGFDMIFAFVVGASIVFVAFGYFIYIFSNSAKKNMSVFKSLLIGIGVISILTVLYSFGGSYVGL